MHLSFIFASFISIAAVHAATTHQVSVGKDGKVAYDPPKLDGVQAGDTIQFQFQSKNHTVTQSTFASPCTPMDKGVDSGYFKVPDGATSFPQWSFTLDDVKGPLWFYCRQPGYANLFYSEM
jgi:plastocyanin